MRVSDRQGGFTLTEVVTVIAILGMLAAFALPRFAALQVEARSAATEALQSRVRSGAALAHARWLEEDRPAFVKVDGMTIGMVNGYPSRTSIDDTLSDFVGFRYSPRSGVFDNTGASATCSVTYTEAASESLAPTISIDTSGC